MGGSEFGSDSDSDHDHDSSSIQVICISEYNLEVIKDFVHVSPQSDGSDGDGNTKVNRGQAAAPQSPLLTSEEISSQGAKQ